MKNIYWICLRLSLGFMLIWAFFDKLLGLGFATKSVNSWINGGSPTSGFLKSLNGPFHFLFNSLSGIGLIDWIFMLSLLLIGLSLITGIYLKYGCIAGIVLFGSMWLALFPSSNNPLIDEHIIYILALIGIWIYDSKKVLI